MAGVLNKLGQTVLPKVFSSLKSAGLVDVMDIRTKTTSTDSAGGQIKSAAAIDYPDIRVSYEPMSDGWRFTQNDRQLSKNRYKLTFPTHTQGERISLDINVHRFIVQERGNEPEQTFRGIAVSNQNGVVFEVECEKES